MKKVYIKRFLSLLVLCMFLGAGIGGFPVIAAADITSSFTDPAFLAYVREVAGKPTEPIYDTDIVDVANLELNSKGIKSLAGIEHFVNLKQLDCFYNQLTTLPTLPDGLEDINVLNNNITSIPASALPSSLLALRCSYNELTALPELPAGLLILACSDNKLTALPTLPAGLSLLDCGNNKLTGLDVTGLASLGYIDCRFNNMTDRSDVKGFTGEWSDDWPIKYYQFSPQNSTAEPAWWESLPSILQWILRIFFFGWIWMEPGDL